MVWGLQARGTRGDTDIGRQPPPQVKAYAPTWIGLVALALLVSACHGPDRGQATPASVVRAAAREGEVVIYTNTEVTGPLVDGFQRRYPAVKARFVDLGARQIHDAVLAESTPGAGKADIVWSSSMDIQIKLINDGYAQTYRSEEARSLPAWAIWRDQGFGVTAEPIGFAYNKRLLKPDQIPRSHAALLETLRADPARWRGQIALYDAERSSVGLMYLSADTQIYPQAWDLLTEIGKSGPGLYISGADIMRRLSSGEHLLVYDMNQFYAAWWARNRDPDIGYILPTDYHVSISRIAFITREAPHPNAARLFVDYLMSSGGQDTLTRAGFYPVRDSGADPSRGARPIRVGPALLANLDQARRASLLAQWRDAVAPSAGAASSDHEAR